MTNKVVLVAGGTSGIGRSVVERALRMGHRVFVTGTDAGRLEAVLDLAGRDRLGGQLSDLTEWEQTREAVEAAASLFGRLDAVIVSAGRGVVGDLSDGDPAEWRQMVLTNVLGPALLVRAALPALERTAGQVVLIGSVMGRKAAPGRLYSATKWAVTGLAESLRQQVTRSGVRVCVVQAGRVDTRFWPDGAPPPALRADSVADAVTWVLAREADVDISEIVIRPVGQEL